MSAVHFRAPLVLVSCACLSASFAEAEPPAAAGPWAKVPPLSELCYQNVNAQQQDPSVSPADWGEGETINKAYDEAYQGLCPQWWGANGKVQTFMKTQKDWFIRERIPFLEKGDAPLLQQYATMNTPAATYRSTAELQAVEEYLDLAWKVYRDRDISARCQRPQDCDGTYP